MVVVGFGFLLHQLEIWDFGRVLGTWWPSVLIAVALLQLVTRLAPRAGSVMLLAGLVLQVWTLELLPENVFVYSWPLAMILVGIWLLVFRGRGRQPQVSSDDRLRHFVMLGAVESRSESKQFTGGAVTALLGEAKLDLTGARLAAEGADLELTCFMGGIEVRVPDNWRVIARGTPILGGWENKTRLKDRDGGADKSVLRVDGFSMLGGVEIRN